jgi:tetratricopeptide (TPR) repeat protein
MMSQTLQPSFLRRGPGMFAGIVILTALFASTSFSAEWYIKYRSGLEAIKGQQWSAAVGFFSEAIAERSEERTKARTVGVQFVDYLPYVYRGLAYAKLGNNVKALQDFERSEKQGEVQNASLDKDALRILRENLARLRTPRGPEKLLEEARTLYRQKHYARALEKLRAIPADSPYHREAQQYIDLAEAEMKKSGETVPQDNVAGGGSREFQEGVQLFDKGDYARAEAKFQSVLRKEPGHAGAQRYLNLSRSMQASSSTAPRHVVADRRRHGASTTESGSGTTEQEALFTQALELYRTGKQESARRLFLTVQSSDPMRQEVGAYLDTIGQTQTLIRNGIGSFFDGEYQNAVKMLGDASRQNSENVSLYAVLAAAYASQYFLNGAEDRTLQRTAIETFRRARQIDASFVLDGKYFSPRIVALLNNQ